MKWIFLLTWFAVLLLLCIVNAVKYQTTIDSICLLLFLLFGVNCFNLRCFLNVRFINLCFLSTAYAHSNWKLIVYPHCLEFKSVHYFHNKRN